MKSLLLRSAIGAAVLGLGAATAFAQGDATAYVAVSHPTSVRGQDSITGPLESSHAMHVVLALKLHDQAQLDQFLADPHHPLLTPQQFTDLYSPTVGQAQAAADFLGQSGFRNVQISSNRLLVSADGTADKARTAFKTDFVRVYTHDGRYAYANSEDLHVPATLQDSVQAVLGMQSVYQAHPLLRYAHPDAVPEAAATASAVGHDPTDFPVIYGASSMGAASSVPVGIISEGSMTNILKDLASFTSANKLPTQTTQVVNTNGTSTDTSGDGEWDLDSQDIVAMTGGVQKLIFYVVPDLGDDNLTADFNTVVTADAVKIINVSIGECELQAQGDFSAQADDAIFAQAAAQGQTFSVSSGDSGADECGDGGVTPSWPASSRYVVAVGGTELYTTGGTTWSSETVWNNLSSKEGATGGSPSTFEPMPSWQSGVGQNAGHTTRGVPDIAFDASPVSGALVIVDGQSNQQIGGTSLASPLFVGSWARILQAQGNVGFAAPFIYQAAATKANYAADFHDVTSGNNSGETAATGWDFTTGFGSATVSELVNNVSITPTAPVANNASMIAIAGNPPVKGGLGAIGSGPLSFAIVTPSVNGKVTLTDAVSGAFTYTPNSGFTGSDSFTFDATNSVGTSNAATVTITVGAALPACASGYVQYFGQIAGAGYSVQEPDGGDYTAAKGTQTGVLHSYTGTVFDLYLYKYNTLRGQFAVVASATAKSNTQTLNYSGTSGQYTWLVVGVTGTGNFDFCVKHP